MKITAIRQQVKRNDRYSLYVDNAYAFSLSQTALLDSKLASGQEIDHKQLEQYKQLSLDDKVYQKTLRYAAMRPRSQWQIETYLDRNQAPPPLKAAILNKLSMAGLIDDQKLARALVHDRRLLRPTSRRKIIMELRNKRLADEVIDQALGQGAYDERTAMRQVIEKKRRIAKYRDNDTLMRYLAGQGFGYGDIKAVLASEEDLSTGGIDRLDHSS